MADIFRAKIVDVEKESLMVELTGTQSKLEAFINLLEGYEILLTCFSICSRLRSSPLATIMILVNLGSAVTPAVMLSMLYPRLLKSPDIRLKTPAGACKDWNHRAFTREQGRYIY